MNKAFLTSICLLILTGCAGFYSHFKEPADFENGYTFDGEERSFDVQESDDDVGSQEMISFE